jgi:hypothetical protein
MSRRVLLAKAIVTVDPTVDPGSEGKVFNNLHSAKPPERK